MKLHSLFAIGVSVATLATAIAPAYAANLDDLYAAAKKEGQLTVIALPYACQSSADIPTSAG